VSAAVDTEQRVRRKRPPVECVSAELHEFGAARPLAVRVVHALQAAQPVHHHQPLPSITQTQPHPDAGSQRHPRTQHQGQGQAGVSNRGRRNIRHQQQFGQCHQRKQHFDQQRIGKCAIVL